MKVRSLMPIVLLALVAGTKVQDTKVEDRGSKVASADPRSSTLDSRSSAIKGDYVEARTASVFCGACHYNGELVTTGRDAVMAWNITSGTWNGVDLAGVRVMAAITSDQNLSDPKAVRTTQLVIDPSATDAQVTAFTDWLHTRDGDQLGRLLPVHRGTVSFRHDASEYLVNAPDLGAINMQPMPNDECCTQPHMVWYEPLMQLEHRKVGFTEEAKCTGGAGDPWDRTEENSAFYGSFASAGK